MRRVRLRDIRRLCNTEWVRKNIPFEIVSNERVIGVVISPETFEQLRVEILSREASRGRVSWKETVWTNEKQETALQLAQLKDMDVKEIKQHLPAVITYRNTPFARLVPLDEREIK